MTSATDTPAPRRLGRSVLAVLGGFLAIVILSTAADEAMYALHIFPPRGQPMHDPALFALATAYRCAIGVYGSWLAAQIAPSRPMRHALIVGGIGFFLSGLGIAVSINRPEMGPLWYPITLAALTLPCAWLGGRLHRPRS